VALLPMSSDVDVQQLWNLILGAFARPSSDSRPGAAHKGEAMEEDAAAGQQSILAVLCKLLLMYAAPTASLSSLCASRKQKCSIVGS